jgi:SAM-dependent methyltransferase
VLISGAADYAMLACLLAAFRRRKVEPEITVVDRCETPLMLSRWYAERVSCKIETRRADLAEYSEVRAFDAICTHSFFSELSPGQRADVIGRWRQLLRPGGLAITANRVRPAAKAEPAGFTPEQAQEFGAAVLRQSQSMREQIQADPLELARHAEIYAGRRRAYPLRSREEIVQLFEPAGFRMDQLSFASPMAGAQAAVSGPTTPAGAQYAYIVAVRR